VTKRTHAFVESLERLVASDCTVREALELLAEDGVTKDLSESILSSLQRGESLAEAFQECGALADKRYKAYLRSMSETGTVRPALMLILRADNRERAFAIALAQALTYPAFILVFLASLLAFLFVEGIPILAGSGLIGGDETLALMYQGCALGAGVVFVVSAAVPLALKATFVAARANEAFWSTVAILTEGGIPFDAAARLAGREGFDPSDERLDPYARTALRAAQGTGDIPGAIGAIARWHEGRLASRYRVVTRFAEPFCVGITGLVVAILCATVFLPIFTFAGTIGG